MMERFCGRLRYLLWNRPWTLQIDSGEIDIWPHVESFFRSFNGTPAKQEWGLQTYRLETDPNSVDQLSYEPGKHLLLSKRDGAFGFSNVHFAFDEMLSCLNGRLIEVEIDDDHFDIRPDPNEAVFGVYFEPDGNACEIPSGAEQTVCRLGQGEETCVFLGLNGSTPSCLKFHGSFTRNLLDRLAEGTIGAKRIGNCALLGRRSTS